MDPGPTARLDEIMHELDMLVFRLEREPPRDIEPLLAERRRLRRELERLRDEIGALVREA